MSHFLYIHKDLSGDPDWNKAGVSVTPYTAVRVRQKFCSKEFALDHLYFGRERHIHQLESLIKERYSHLTGKAITGMNQTELFKVSQSDLVAFINLTIKERHFHIQKVELKKPYSAANAGNCPFGIPSEGAVWQWANRLVDDRWGNDPYRTPQQMFDELFES
jgi:hypothetical protein